MSPKPWMLWLALIVLAAALRALPHPPDVTPLAVLAVLGGACSNQRRLAWLVPCCALALGDLVRCVCEGTPLFPSLSLVVYLSLAGSVAIGLTLRRAVRRGSLTLAPYLGAVVGSSLTFFVLSNLGVWGLAGWYPRTGSGLLACFVAALPFLPLTVGGDLLFGSGAWLGWQTLCSGRQAKPADAALTAEC